MLTSFSTLTGKVRQPVVKEGGEKTFHVNDAQCSFSLLHPSFLLSSRRFEPGEVSGLTEEKQNRVPKERLAIATHRSVPVSLFLYLISQTVMYFVLFPKHAVSWFHTA